MTVEKKQSEQHKKLLRVRLVVLSVICVVLFVFFIGSFVHSRIKKNNLECGLQAYKEKRYSEAVSFFRKAASYGATEAQFMLGECYHKGYGVENDPLEAYHWYHMAEKNDYKGAREIIVNGFIDPGNLIMDKTEALEICSRGAEMGSRNAQYKLGLLMEQDSKQVFAYNWFMRAAEQGHSAAQYKLGECYEYAKGIGKNYVQACYWYEKAADQGIKDAKNAVMRVKLARTNARKNALKKREAVSVKNTSDDSSRKTNVSVKNTSDDSSRKTTVLSSSDPWDPITWRREEEIDEARYGYNKAPYKCRRCGMRSFDPLDDGVRGVDGYCIDCINYLFF